MNLSELVEHVAKLIDQNEKMIIEGHTLKKSLIKHLRGQGVKVLEFECYDYSFKPEDTIRQLKSAKPFDVVILEIIPWYGRLERKEFVSECVNAAKAGDYRLVLFKALGGKAQADAAWGYETLITQPRVKPTFEDKMKNMTHPPAEFTLADLKRRQAQLKQSPDYVPSPDNEAAAVMLQFFMGLYRLAPLLSWQGGPFYGAEIQERDKVAALFNFAAVLQHGLKQNLLGFNEALGLEDLKMSELWEQDMKRLADMREDEIGAYVMAFSDWATIDRASTVLFGLAPFLEAIGCTYEHLAAAYMEATNGLIPPAIPEGAEVVAEGITYDMTPIGGVE